MMFGEKATVQNPILKYAQEIGWSYISPEESLRLRQGETGLIHRTTFIDQFVRLNSDFADPEMANQIIKRLEKSIRPDIEGNLQAWEHLTGNGTIFVPGENRERTVRLIDFENIDRNVFEITDEFRFNNKMKPNKPDIVFLVNGIPLFILEAKAPYRLEGISIGIVQIKRYHEETPELMKIPQSYQVSNIIDFLYAPTWNLSSKNLFRWNLEADADLERQVKSFFEKKRSLTFIRDYILFVKQDDEMRKVVLRPHQVRASEKIVERVVSTKKRGLVWHTQGSGKTYTMLVAAKKIMDNRLIIRPKILLLVDRNELESQLFNNLSSLGFENFHVTENKRELQKLLSTDISSIIVSTIQKFDGMPANINDSSNIIVLVDEAHRSTGQKLGNYMMGALPNATYIGFTGTPVSRSSGKNDTFIIFGRDDPNGYLDKYGIKESITDGTTVPLKYSLAPSQMLVDREMLEKDFLKNVELEGVSDIETLNVIIEKQVRLRNMMKNQERMDTIAKYVAKHFRENVEPLGYKAFLVAVDRESCAMYKKFLDQYLPPSYSEVIISVGYNDTKELREYHRTEEQERDIRKAFRNPDTDPKILIVTDKLLTGFDAPILYCMYLDKPMRDHVLLQAIARINRPYESSDGKSKPAGFVIDFVGIFGRLKEALAFDAQDISDIEDVMQDVEILKVSFSEKIQKMKEDYLDKISNEQPDKVVGEILEMFSEQNDRQKYYSRWGEIEDMYDIISPDEFLSPYLKDFENFARIYNILRLYYDNRQRPDDDLSQKTAELVKQYTKINGLKTPKSAYIINEETLDKIKQEKKTDREKILSMINSILNEKNKEMEKEPFLISIGERAEKLASLYRENQQSSEATAKELESLINEINDARKEKDSLRMNPDVFTLYFYLKKSGITDPKRTANAMSDLFSKYPKWRTNARQERDIRQEFNITLSSQSGNSDEQKIKNTKIVKEIIDRLKEAGNDN